MKRTIQIIKRKARNKAGIIADRFTKACAPYEVRCTYGTKQAVWTLHGALEWATMTDGLVVVVHRATGELVATRNEVN